MIRIDTPMEDLGKKQLPDMVAQMHSASSLSHRMVRTLLQYSDSDMISNSHSRFDIQVIIILALLICVIICVVVLHYLIRHVTRYRQCNGESCSEQNAESLASEKNDSECTSEISYSIYKSPMQSLSGGSECAICLGEFRATEDERVLPNCKHSFHPHCIAMWLCSHTSCPTCRNEVPTSWPETLHVGPFSEGMLCLDMSPLRRSPGLVGGHAFRSSSLLTMLSEDGPAIPALLFAEALSPSPSDHYVNR